MSLLVPIAHLYKHMIGHNGPILPLDLNDESVDDLAIPWILFSHTGIYITAIGSLIPTGLWIFHCYCFWCQHNHLSMPTFLIQFFTAYYCGWWCRDSSHLKKWQHGWTACYKTLPESWPAHEAETYMDRESTEATGTIENSSWIWTSGYKTQNPRTQWAHMVCCKT